MTSQTDVFTQFVRDHMRAAPPCVTGETPCAEAVRRMSVAEASALAVVDAHGVLSGIVTEQDVVRRLVLETPPDAPIASVMTTPVTTLPDDARLYLGIAAMRRHHLRHMPVVDGSGKPVGLLELHDALSVAATQMVDQIDRLGHDRTMEGLVRVKAEQINVAEQLIADSVPAPEILALISSINIDLYRRALAQALDGLAASGAGAPPVGFALIVMGSGGRGESSFQADQDNGFVLADYPDSDHDRIDGYFRDLARRMTVILDGIGLPLCRGGVMASNPLWRKTVGQWQAQLAFWLAKRNDSIARLGDIFFDFCHADGDPDLSRAVRDTVTALVPGSWPFLSALHDAQAHHHTALGLFGSLRRERHGRQRGMINLKYGASLPLVEAVRLMALRAGLGATGTIQRIEGLADAGEIDSDMRESLTDAFMTITLLTLRWQIAEHHARRPASYWIPPSALSRRRRRSLVAALRSVEAFRGQVDHTFSGTLF